MTIKSLSILMVMIGAVILFLSFSPAIKICRNLIGGVRRKWVIILYLMGFFILGYLSFDIILISNLSFPLELVTGGVFLGGAVFVFIVMNISLSTVTALQKSDEAIHVAKDDWESTFDAVTDMVTIHDMDFNIIRANPAARKAFGQQQHEGLSSNKCFNCYHGTEKPPSGCVSCQSLQTGKPSAFEMFEPHLNKHLEIRAMPRFGKDGRPVGLIHVVRDITDRVLAEKAMQSLSCRQEAMLAAIPDIIMEMDADKVYTWANQFGLDFFGEDVIGKEAAYYFEGEQDTYEALNPLFSGEEDVIYVRSWQRRIDGQKQLLAWLCRAIKDSAGTVTGVISTARNITKQKLAEDAIIREKTLSNNIINSLPGMFYMFDERGKLGRWNKKFVEATGYTHDELRRMHFTDFFTEAHKHYMTLQVQSVFAGGEDVAEASLLTKTGEQVPYFFTGRLAVLEDKQFLLGYGVDMTERMRAREEKDSLQAQLVQAQKMESVGRLAGGVAHDYNNALSVIIGFTELAMEKIDPAEPLRADLDQVLKAAIYAADITRQLLAFARKQTIAPKVLDMNDTIENMLKMLRRLIGENIDLAWMPGAEVWPVKIDPSQVDQILTNLCVNARDAIADVGKITIETGNAIFDEDYCEDHAGFIPGEYVLLALSDDGSGMTPETLDKLFEPFFTTKDVNKGTGLGLATVYGIVKQNKGFINVYSEPEKGTTFRIYFSRHETNAEQIRKKAPVMPDARGSETILLVEDEPSILEMTTIVLELLGYTVLGASTPGEAIRLAETHPDQIDLIITDVILPEMNGRDLARNLLTQYPNLKCLFMSGYTANVIAHHGVLDEGVNFIQKPFARKDLASKVREALSEMK